MIAFFPYFIAACALALAFCALMLFRNEIVFTVRGKAIDATSAAAKGIIRNGGHDWHAAYRIMEDFGTYDQMVWSFRKWRFDAFYPMLDVKLAELQGAAALQYDH
jgi:hypothetical protein